MSEKYNAEATGSPEKLFLIVNGGYAISEAICK